MLPTGDLLAHVGRLDGSAAGASARNDAGRGARLRGSVSRVRAADRHRHRRIPLLGSCSSRTASPSEVLDGIARARRRRRSGGVRVPRPRGVPAPRRVRHRRALCARAAGRAAPRDPRRGRGGRHAGVGRRRADRRGPRAGAGAASSAVRRAAGGGPADVQAPRRARRLQRHLGLRDHAAGRAGGRSPARRQGQDPRRRAFRRRRLRRDARTAVRRGRTLRRRARRAVRVAHLARRQGGAGGSRSGAPASAGPVRPAAGAGTGHAGDRHRDRRVCSAARRRRTKRTSCAGSPRAAAPTKVRPAASPARRSSTGS